MSDLTSTAENSGGRNRAGFFARAWPAIVISCAAANLAASDRISSGADWFNIGTQNIAPDYLFYGPGWGWLFPIWSVTGLILLVASFLPRNPALHLARGGLAICWCVLPVQCYNHTAPLECYELGFQQWTCNHIKPEPIQRWCSSLAPVTKATKVAPNSWPEVISLLSPDRVFQLPDRKGVILEWGMVGAWGDSRRVFIGANDQVAPPSDDDNVLFRWRMAYYPGVYAAYQYTD